MCRALLSDHSIARAIACDRIVLYLGEVVMLTGAGLVFNRATLLIAAIAFAVLVTRLAIRPEEDHLARRFGDVYAGYRARVRRWI
jgi:protein-S-isoprenylcysteine O-methyltransferase Ste14